MKLKRTVAILIATLLLTNSVFAATSQTKPTSQTAKKPSVPGEKTETNPGEEACDVIDYSKVLQEIEYNVREPRMEYKAATILPINYLNGITNYVPSKEVLQEQLQNILPNIDIVEWYKPSQSNASKALLGNTENDYAKHLNYLYENQVFSPNNNVSITKGSSLSVNSDISNLIDPKYQPTKSEIVMALVKTQEGVIPSRPIVDISPNILKRAPDKLTIPLEFYQNKQKLSESVVGTDPRSVITYKNGDVQVYSSPNVLELYLQRAVAKGIVSLYDLNPNTQTARDIMATMNNSGVRPRWDNSLPPVFVNANPVLTAYTPLTNTQYDIMGSQVVQGSNVFGAYYNYKNPNTGGSGNPFDGTGSTQGATLSANEMLGTAISQDFSASPNNQYNNFPVEKISLWDLYQLIYKTQLAYEETITDAEKSFVEFAFGVNYVTPQDTHDVLGQLIVTGIINPEKPSEIANIFRPVTNEELYKYLYRLKNKDARLTFKEVQLSATDSFFKEKGFKKNQITSSEFEQTPSLQPQAKVETRKGEKQLDDLFTVKYVLNFTDEAPPPPNITTGWFFIADNELKALGYRGVDYKVDQLSPTKFVFSLTQEHYKTISKKGVASVQLNSAGATDTPVKISLPNGPGDYVIEAEGTSTNQSYKGVQSKKFNESGAPQSLLDELLNSLFPIAYGATPQTKSANTYKVTTVIYDPTGKMEGIIDVESGKQLKDVYPFPGNNFVDMGNKYYQFSRDIQAKDADTAAAILDRSISLMNTQKNQKMLGYTVENETLVAQSDLSSYGIVKIHDKLLYSAKTDTFALIMDDKDIVMVGSSSFKFPKGTTMLTSPESKEIYYNLKAIAALLSLKEVQLFNNKDLVFPSNILTAVNSRTPIENASAEQIDTFLKEDSIVQGRNFFALSSMTTATKNFSISYVKEGYDIVVQMEQDFPNGMFDPNKPTPSPNEVQFAASKEPSKAAKPDEWKEFLLNKALLTQAITECADTPVKAQSGYIKTNVRFLFKPSVTADQQQQIMDAFKTKAEVHLPKDSGLKAADFAGKVSGTAYNDGNNMFISANADDNDKIFKFSNGAIYIPAKVAGIIKTGKYFVYDPVKASGSGKTKGNQPLDHSVYYKAKINGQEFVYDGSMSKNKKLFAKFESTKQYTVTQAEANKLKLQSKIAAKYTDVISPSKGVLNKTVIINPFESNYLAAETDESILKSCYIKSDKGYLWQPKNIKGKTKVYSIIGMNSFLDNPGQALPDLSYVKAGKEDAAKPILISEVLWLSVEDFKVDTANGNKIVYDPSAPPVAMNSSYFTLSVITPMIKTVIQLPHYEIPKSSTVILGATRMKALSSDPNKKEATYMIKSAFTAPLNILNHSKGVSVSIDKAKLEAELRKSIEAMMFSDGSLLANYVAPSKISITELKDAEEAGFNIEDTLLTKGSKDSYVIAGKVFTGTNFAKGKYAVHNTTLKGPLTALLVPDKDNPYYIMLPPPGAGLLGLSLTFDIMDGESLNFQGNSLTISEKKGDWLLSKFKETNLFNLTFRLKDFEIDSILDALFAFLTITSWWLGMITLIVWTFNRLTGLPGCNKLYDLYGIDVVKWATLGTWQLNSDYSFIETMVRMFLIQFVAVMIDKLYMLL